LKVFASYWSGRLVDADTTIISNVTSASSISVGSSFPYDHLILPLCTKVDQDIEIRNNELETATFTSLVSIGDDVVIDSNPFLSAANLSALLSITGDLYIANNLQFLSANFMRVTRIDGSLSLINNNVLTSVVLSALTAIVGQLLYSGSHRITAPGLLTINGLGFGQCVGFVGSDFSDVLHCSRISGGREISSSTAISLVNPVQTRADGFLYIRSNNILNRIDFASLSFVGDALDITKNPALTLVSLPRLSQVQGVIYLCQNAPSFVLPNVASGTAAPPGLTSVSSKGFANCCLQQGSTAFVLVTCP
jgi:hypothetical protein